MPEAEACSASLVYDGNCSSDSLYNLKHREIIQKISLSDISAALLQEAPGFSGIFPGPKLQASRHISSTFAAFLQVEIKEFINGDMK